MLNQCSKKRIAIAFAALFSLTTAHAADSFSELDAEVAELNKTQAEKVADFHAYVNQYLDQYETWRDAYTQDLDKKKAELISNWGQGDVSDNTTSVMYSDDGTVRTTVNYENGTMEVSVLTDTQKMRNNALKLAKERALTEDNILIDLINAQISEKEVAYTKVQELTERQFILDQTEKQMNEMDIQAERLVNTNTGIPADFIYERAYNKKMNLLKQAQERINNLSKLYNKQRYEYQLVTAKQSSKIPKKVVNYKVKLPKSTLSSRAKKYKPFAEKESKRFNIDAPLVMAIMHSESAFRPRAKSHIPAYGLMQIVPNSAGRDVNRHLRQKNKPMTAKELYNAPINVETGTAYLHILNHKYLKHIKNDESRLYCTIAAYNTGTGNVARAFNKNRSTNIKKASAIINKMTPQQVYNRLLSDLPYSETKTYLARVNGRIALYR